MGKVGFQIEVHTGYKYERSRGATPATGKSWCIMNRKSRQESIHKFLYAKQDGWHMGKSI